MNQRDKMRQLFQLHGETGMKEILRLYAQAERSGEVIRKKKGKLTAEEYAVRLYNDGIKKGWIREHPSSSNTGASTKRAYGELQEYGSTTCDKQIPTCELTPELLPEDRASWDAILKFAYSFDGYDYWPEKHKCGEIGNSVRQTYHDTGRFQASIDILRTALFFEARRYHDNVLDRESLAYIWALISEIRRQLSRNRPMTFEEIINAEFDPEEIKVAVELNGRVGDVCDCYCDKCANITPGTLFNKDDHCGSCTIYEHGDECDCDACEFNSCDLIEEMRMACCYARLEELSKTDKTPEVIQEMEDIQCYLSDH